MFRKIDFNTAMTIFNAEDLTDITESQLKAKYKELSLKYHPDKYTPEKGKEFCEEFFKAIKSSYELLLPLIEFNKKLNETLDGIKENKANNKSRKRKHDCCDNESETNDHQQQSEQNERPKKRRHVKTSNVVSASLFKQEKNNANFQQSKSTIVYYFSDDWRMKSNDAFIIIESDELRKLQLQIIIAKDSAEKEIYIVLPPIVSNEKLVGLQENLTRAFHTKLNDLHNIYQDTDKNTRFSITNDNKLIIEILEFIISTFQMNQTFGQACRGMLYTNWSLSSTQSIVAFGASQ